MKKKNRQTLQLVMSHLKGTQLEGLGSMASRMVEADKRLDQIGPRPCLSLTMILWITMVMAPTWLALLAKAISRCSLEG